jgi:galactokinase
MSRQTLEAQLGAAGVAPADVPGRAGLVRLVARQHLRIFGRPAAHAWFVPGRIEVFGKHTDYAGGQSLLAAVPRGFAVAISPRNDRVLRVLDARWRDRATIDPYDDQVRHTGWSNYVAVVARRLARNFPGADLGGDLTVASDLPRAAGVSSSSAFVVGVAMALADRARLADRPEWQAAIQTRLDLAGYLGAVENGLTFRTLDGTSGVGTHGGSEDHTAILASQPDQVSAYAFVPVRTLGHAAMPPGWSFVVMSSGVHADKAGRVKDQYNRASLATRALLDVWNAREETPALTLAQALATDVEAASRLREWAEDGRDGFDGAALIRRLEHFIAESARALPAADAFRRADSVTLGELSQGSQDDARELLGNQIPATDRLAALAREVGAFAATSFGAGFGGSVWALVPAGDVDRFPQVWLDAYRREFPELTNVEWFSTRPAPPALALELSG